MVVEYLTAAQKKDVHWRVTTHRPPSEGSHFSATFAAVRGLQAYATGSQQEAIARRLADVREWLETAEAHDTEDRVFRDLFFALAANTPRYGGVVPLTRRHALDDGLLEVTTFTARSLGARLGLLTQALRGRLDERAVRGITQQQAASITITPATPLPVEVDGDLAHFSFGVRRVNALASADLRHLQAIADQPRAERYVGRRPKIAFDLLLDLANVFAL